MFGDALVARLYSLGHMLKFVNGRQNIAHPAISDSGVDRHEQCCAINYTNNVVLPTVNNVVLPTVNNVVLPTVNNVVLPTVNNV